MGKKVFVSIFFSLFILVFLFGLTKIASGDLDTNVANTKIVLYGEGVFDNTSMTKGGVSELVNFTIASTSDVGYNITNITIELIDGGGNYTFIGWVSTGSEDTFENDNNTDTFVNVTEWADGTSARWTCTNSSLYLLGCENSTLDAVLDGTYNTSITIKFNVTATSSKVEDVAAWNVTTYDDQGEANSTVIYSYVDGIAPRVMSVNVTDGNVTWQNDTETSNGYEVDGDNSLTVNVNIQEMNPDSTSVFLVINNSGNNASEAVGSHVWNVMTQSRSPGWAINGVYTYSYSLTDALNIGNLTNFIIVVNDTYNNIEYINSTIESPFSFTPNRSLVSVNQLNITTSLNEVIHTITSPTTTTEWINGVNNSIDVVIGGQYKGQVFVYFNETGGPITGDANLESFSGWQLAKTLWVGPEADHPNNYNITSISGTGEAIYSWSMDFIGNHTKNVYMAVLVNSTDSDTQFKHVSAANYSTLAVYNFKVDEETAKPTITAPSSTTITISDTTGLKYTCVATEPDSGVNKYTWTLTKPNGVVITYTDTTTATSLDRTFSGSDIDRAGTHNLKCKVTDLVGNEATSDSSSFTVSYETTTSSGGGGGSSGGGAAITPTVSFDVDFSKATTGTISAQQGRIKSFSFDGATKHTVSFDKVTATSATLTIASSPITINLNVGESKSMDINKDGSDDISVKLKNIANGLANIEISKIEAGAKIVAKEEKEAISGAEKPVTEEQPIVREEVTPVKGSSAWLWVTLLIVVIVVGIGYYSYKKK